MKKHPLFSFLLLFLMLAVACDPILEPMVPTARPTIEAATPEPEQPTAIPPTATATETAPRLWIDPLLPEAFLDEASRTALSSYSSEWESAQIALGYEPEVGMSEWIYALAAPFETVADAVSRQDLMTFWKNGGSFLANELVMTEATKAAIESVLGSSSGHIRTFPKDEVTAYVRQNSWAWAILPFTEVEPEFKVIAIEGNSPIQKSFDAENYLLSVPIGLQKTEQDAIDQATFEEMVVLINELLPRSNRDADKLTTIVMTGVTAMARATGKEMELYGVTSPAVSVGALMREADIAHVSNEVPFARDCPPPQWVQEVDLVFCSDVKYIDLMREVGTDVVELTGDHFADWGAEAMYLTLEMYREEGWNYYGGGWDIDEARLPLKLEHNGNKIAFLGCNAKAPGYATASPTVPGALHCDMDDIASKIAELSAEGYMVIVTFQHQEIYRWNPTEDMIRDSRRAGDAGATIVSGSQAHVPHVYEFYGGSFIHYGLGNLFFDQLGWFDDSDKAFLDRHVFYDGKYLGVELITVEFFNWSTPTLMTPEARVEMLSRLFEYSVATFPK